MTNEDALREIARVVQDPASRASRKVDRVFRVLVQAGVIVVPGVTVSGGERSQVRSALSKTARR